MQTPSPFNSIFHNYGNTPLSHAESINREALHAILSKVSQPVPATGHSIFLSSPRAGYGKTHLLSMLQIKCATTHEMILLRPDEVNCIDSKTVIADALDQITRSLPAGGGLTALDFITRRLFALGLEPLVRSGELPCEDREQAIHSFLHRPIETFDFHHPEAKTAHWIGSNYEILGPRIMQEISDLIAAPTPVVRFWVNAFFYYAIAQKDQVARKVAITNYVFGSQHPWSHFELLSTLLKLLTHTQRIVLIADELEGFSTDQEGALRLVSLLTLLRSSIDRLDIIFSVNDDVWGNAFAPKITGGLLDRLSEFSVRLEPLSHQNAIDLLTSRSDVDPKLLEHLTNSSILYSRDLLRSADAFYANSGLISPQMVNHSFASGAVTRDQAPAPAEAASVQAGPSYFGGVSPQDASPGMEASLEATTVASSDICVNAVLIAPSSSPVQDFSQLHNFAAEKQVVAATEDFTNYSELRSEKMEQQNQEESMQELLKRFREKYDQPKQDG